MTMESSVSYGQTVLTIPGRFSVIRLVSVEISCWAPVFSIANRMEAGFPRTIRHLLRPAHPHWSDLRGAHSVVAVSPAARSSVLSGVFNIMGR